MRYNILAAVFAVILGFCALPAHAQTQTGHSCTGGVGECITVEPGDTTLSATVVLPAGRVYYAVFNGDITASADTGDATATIYGPCTFASSDYPPSVNTCGDLYVDDDLNGGISSNALTGDCGSTGVNLCSRYGLPGGVYFVTFSADAASGEIAGLNFEVQSQ